MSAVVNPWEIVGHIDANDDTRPLWADPLHIYRIKADDDGAFTAPSAPTARRSGVLVRRLSLPLPVPARDVAVAPLSKDRLR